jgi:hypothetical protein
MLDHLKRLCLVAIATASLGTVALVAPAEAQESKASTNIATTAAPAQAAAQICHSNPPGGTGWNFVRFFDVRPGVACAQCLALAGGISPFYETWCWYASDVEAFLYYRSR